MKTELLKKLAIVNKNNLIGELAEELLRLREFVDDIIKFTPQGENEEWWQIEAKQLKEERR